MEFTSNKTYLELYKDHNDYLCHKHEQYLFIYDELIQSFIKKNQPISLLEIGVQNGGSLQLWEKYLPKGSKIYGVDIDPGCDKLNFSENITFILGNATDEKFVKKNLKNLTFDIIIDDGSHVSKDIIKTFELLFDTYLNMGGLYIIEDMHCCYWEDFDGGFRHDNSAITYFSKTIDALNYDYYKLPLTHKDKNSLKRLNSLIKRISFYDSICAIEKYSTLKKDKFLDCRASDIALVHKNPLLSTEIKKNIKKIDTKTKNLFIRK